MFIFPDTENTGNMPKNTKNMFLRRELTSYTENFKGRRMHQDCGGQSNNRMKFLQQTLLHLGLWFKVYIGRSISLHGQCNRINVKLTENKKQTTQKQTKNQGNHS